MSYFKGSIPKHLARQQDLVRPWAIDPSLLIVRGSFLSIYFLHAQSVVRIENSLNHIQCNCDINHNTQPLYCDNDDVSDNDDRLIIITLISCDVRYSSKSIPLANLYRYSKWRAFSRTSCISCISVMRKSVVLKSIGCLLSKL